MGNDIRLGSSVDRAVGFEPTSVAGSNPAQVAKRCSKCKEPNELVSGKGYCKLCQREMSKSHYERNRQSYYDRNERRKKANNLFLKEYKDNPCLDCGNSYPYYVMDLHHRDGEEKEALISQLVNKTTLPRLKRELAKCDLLCANCHRERTFG